MINGNKYWCTFADGADFMIVHRPRPPTRRSGKRASSACRCSSIEKKRGTLPTGVNGAPIPKIGYFGWKTWELAFDNCRVPARAT